MYYAREEVLFSLMQQAVRQTRPALLPPLLPLQDCASQCSAAVLCASQLLCRPAVLSAGPCWCEPQGDAATE
jgi:hypothetical protein